MAKTRDRRPAKDSPAKPARVALWDSESDTNPLVDTNISFSRELPGGDIAVVVDCYDLTGAHGRSSILFAGPTAVAIAKKWHEFFVKNSVDYSDCDDDPDAEAAAEDAAEVNANLKPLEALDKFIAWLAKP